MADSIEGTFNVDDFIRDWNDPRLTTLEIAARHHISKGSVSNYAKRFDLPKRTRGRKLKDDAEEELAGGEWVTRNGVRRFEPFAKKQEPTTRPTTW